MRSGPAIGNFFDANCKNALSASMRGNADCMASRSGGKRAFMAPETISMTIALYCEGLLFGFAYSFFSESDRGKPRFRFFGGIGCMNHLSWIFAAAPEVSAL